MATLRIILTSIAELRECGLRTLTGFEIDCSGDSLWLVKYSLWLKGFGERAIVRISISVVAKYVGLRSMAEFS